MSSRCLVAATNASALFLACAYSYGGADVKASGGLFSRSLQTYAEAIATRMGGDAGPPGTAAPVAGQLMPATRARPDRREGAAHILRVVY